jgi:hypothetical protein
MKTNISKHVYESPHISVVGSVEAEHSFLSHSIIIDNQEVEIDIQDGGPDEDIFYHTW